MMKARVIAGLLLLLPIFTMASEVNQPEATEKVQAEVAEIIQPEVTENDQSETQEIDQSEIIKNDQAKKSIQVQPDITISGEIGRASCRERV